MNVPWYFTYEGENGTLELLPFGEVERECERNGERIYELHEIGELLVELREHKAPVSSSRTRDSRTSAKALGPTAVTA